MDCPTNPQAYLIVKDVITFCLTLGGLIVAGLGLQTWRKQIKGPKEFDISYNLHYAVLKLRDSIKSVRHPAIWPAENRKAKFYSKEKYPDLSEEEIEANNHSYVYEMRWEEIIKAGTEMESHLLAAEVLWGAEITELVKPLNQKITELHIALKQKFQPALRTHDLEKLDAIIYNTGLGSGKEDDFSQEVNKEVLEITNYLKSKTKGYLYS